VRAQEKGKSLIPALMPATRPFSPIKKNCCVCACAYASLKAVVFALVASVASGNQALNVASSCVLKSVLFLVALVTSFNLNG